MKALRLSRENNACPPTLTLTDIPTPTLSPGELLIKIHASPIQPADILNSKGSFPSTTFPRIPGKDFSGIVTGPASSPWLHKSVLGTSGSTFSFTTDGAHAEFTIVREDAVALKPDSLSWAQAASLGTPLTTANMTLVRAGAKKGDVVMVLGATGAVGSFVMQLAANVYGCKTISVGRHGTDINSVSDPELQTARALTDGRGPDVVVDTVGDLALSRAAFNVLNQEGRMAFISAPRGGASTEMPVDVLSLYRRQISLIGCNSAAEPQEALAKMLSELSPHFETGALKAPEESSMNLIGIDQALDAYAGKVKKAVIVFE